MVASSRNADPYQPVRDGRLVVAPVASRDDVLFSAQQIPLPGLGKSNLEELVRSDSGNLDTSVSPATDC